MSDKTEGDYDDLSDLSDSSDFSDYEYSIIFIFLYNMIHRRKTFREKKKKIHLF